MPYSPPPQTNDKVVYVTGSTQPAYWIDAANNKPYNYVTVNGTPDYSKKNYLSPAALNPNTGGDFDKQKEWGMPQGQSFLHQRAQWNSQKGEWEQPINWSNIMAAGTGAAIAAPAIVGALGAGGAGAGGAASTTIPTTSLAGGVAGGAGAIAPSAAFGTAATGGAAAATGGLAATIPTTSLAGGVGGGAGALTPTAAFGTAGGGAAGAGGSSVMNFLGSQGGQQLVSTGVNAVGGYLKGKADAKQAQAQREDDMRKSIANFLMNQQQMQLGASQMNPYAQAEHLNSANVRRSFAQGWSPQGGFNGNFDMSAFDPSNLASENKKFQGTANNPDLNAQIMQYLSQIGRK